MSNRYDRFLSFNAFIVLGETPFFPEALYRNNFLIATIREVREVYSYYYTFVFVLIHQLQSS